MLTGRETVPATFAATAHLHWARAAAAQVLPGAGVVTTAWGTLATEVRHAALALSADGAGRGTALRLDPVSPRRDKVVTILVASVVGALVDVAVRNGDRPFPVTVDLRTLAPRGAAIDDRHPDRFEQVVAQRTAGEPLLRCGDVVHTHRSLLVAARSLAQAAGIGTGDRLLVDLAVGSAGELVADVLIPSLTGATSWSVSRGASVAELAPGQRPTLVITGAAGAPEAMSPAAGRMGAGRRRGRAAVRTVVVAGDGGGPLPPTGASGATALAVEPAGGLITGFGSPGTLGRPLPGVILAVDDDGAVLVRAASVPPDAPGRRDDGWLTTGLTGDLTGGELTVDGAASPSYL